MGMLIGKCPNGHVVIAIEETGQEFHIEGYEIEGMIKALQIILKDIEESGTAKRTVTTH